MKIISVCFSYAMFAKQIQDEISSHLLIDNIVITIGTTVGINYKPHYEEKS